MKHLPPSPLGALSRRDALRLGANLGLASFAVGMGGVLPAQAQRARALLGHFPSANQQNFANATGSMAAAMGEGVDVEFVGVSAGPQILTAMAANGMDLCNIGSSPLIVGFAQGLEVSMVWMHKVVRDSEALVVKADQGIETLADLRGKRIGCPFNTSVHFAAMVALETAGLTAADVEFVNLRPDALLAAWTRGSIDAAYIWFPVLGALADDGGEVIFETGALQDHGVMVFDGLVCRDAFKRDHPDLVLAYLQELHRINGIYRDDPQQVVDVMAPFLQVSPELVMTIARTTHTISPAEMLTDEWMGAPGATDSGILRAIDRQADFLAATGQLPNRPDSFAPFVDSSFVARMV